MKDYLFAYGTLQSRAIQRKVIGRIVSSKRDSISGFKRIPIEIENHVYPALVESEFFQGKIGGLLLTIEEEDLKKLDEYETSAYRREKARLDSGIEAWIYVIND